MLKTALGFMLFIVLVIGFIKEHTDARHDFAIIAGKTSISRAEATVITEPGLTGKKTVIVADKVELDSLSQYLRQYTVAIGVQQAKLNTVFVLLDLQKGVGGEVELTILNSKYTGWLVQVGGENYTNEYVVRWVNKNILKY